MIFKNSTQLAVWLAAQYPQIFTELQRRAGSYSGSVRLGRLGRLGRRIRSRRALGQLCICGLSCLVGCDSWTCDLSSESDWGSGCEYSEGFASCVNELFGMDCLTDCAQGPDASISSCVSNLLCGSTSPALCTDVTANLDCEIACSSTAQCLNLSSCVGSSGVSGAGGFSNAAINSVAGLLSSASGLASLAALASEYFSAGAVSSSPGASAAKTAASSSTSSATVPGKNAVGCQVTPAGACYAACGLETGGALGSSTTGLLLIAAVGVGLYYFLKR